MSENLALAARRGKHRGLRWGLPKGENQEFTKALEMLGQRQAITLIMATMQKPKLLLLDEHTAALDPKTAAKVLDITDQVVNQSQLTTLMITHNMNDAIRHGNRLIMMDEGRIILDIQGEEKKKLTVDQLLKLFAQAGGENALSDRMLLHN